MAEFGEIVILCFASQEFFLGHSLHDSTPTILHHYVTAKAIHYPNFPSGWALSAAALNKSVNSTKHSDKKLITFILESSIISPNFLHPSTLILSMRYCAMSLFCLCYHRNGNLYVVFPVFALPEEPSGDRVDTQTSLSPKRRNKTHPCSRVLYSTSSRISQLCYNLPTHYTALCKIFNDFIDAQ